MTTIDTQKQNKLAVIFPGIGYSCDRSLLYYTAVMMREHGYRVIPVPYTGFPKNVKGDAQKMRECYAIAQDQAAEILRAINFSDYDDIVFVGKSIGTVVALAIARQFGLKVRAILYTPLAETFELMPVQTPGSTSVNTYDWAFAFHGTSDPWAKTPEIIDACLPRGIPLHIVENANHSLETGDLDNDLQILEETMEQVRRFLAITDRLT